MSSHTRNRTGFTLIELLVVVALISILVTMAGISVPGALGSQRLSGAARQLAADLNQASLLARKEDKMVELRFYELPPADVQGEVALRAYQFGLVTGWDAGGRPVVAFSGEVQRLPEDVVLMPGEKYNTLQGLAYQTGGVVGTQRDVRYVSYYLAVDGSTSLPIAKADEEKNREAREQAVLTLVRETSQGVPRQLPDDFRSVVINKETHQARVF